MARDNDRQQQMPARQYGTGGLSRGQYYGRGGESDWWSASPFQMMRRMQEEMDRVFNSFFGQPQGFSGGASGGSAQGMTAWAPSVDAYETENELVIKADVPGVAPEDLEVYCTDDAIVIRGETRREEERQEQGGHRRERRYGRFERHIPLPPGARVEEAQANCRNGVLEVRVPKSEEARQPVRRIPIGGMGARAEEKAAYTGAKGGQAGSASQPSPGGATPGSTTAADAGPSPGSTMSQQGTLHDESAGSQSPRSGAARQTRRRS